MTIFIYAALIFLTIRFSVTLFNFLSNPKLPRTVKHYQDKVSILIPARNEAENILQLLQSIKEQDYTNYEVIVMDDNSSDNTFELTSDFSEYNEQFSILKGKELPEGWLGKNYACHQLAEIATGRYFLFIDADEIVKRGLINSLIFRVENNGLSLLSIFTNQVMLSFGEKITVPLMHFILLNLLPLRLVRFSKNPAFSAASGQCMFFEAANYKEIQWHKCVKNRVVEDIEIMKLVKQAGFKAEALLANGLIHCRMYKNLGESINGFSKNLLAGFGNNIIILLLYQLLVISWPILLFVNYDLYLLALPFTLIVLSRIMISFLSGQNVVLNLILHPLQMLLFLLISVKSISNHLLKRGSWKGRLIKPI